MRRQMSIIISDGKCRRIYGKFVFTFKLFSTKLITQNVRHIYIVLVAFTYGDILPSLRTENGLTERIRHSFMRLPIIFHKCFITFTKGPFYSVAIVQIKDGQKIKPKTNGARVCTGNGRLLNMGQIICAAFVRCYAFVFFFFSSVTIRSCVIRITRYLDIFSFFFVALLDDSIYLLYNNGLEQCEHENLIIT